jgi:hypothetical protein
VTHRCVFNVVSFTSCALYTPVLCMFLCWPARAQACGDCTEGMAQ